jgi:DNA-binding NtrC family response regulator
LKGLPKDYRMFLKSCGAKVKSAQVSIEKIVDPEEPLELKQIKACLAKYDNNKSKTAKALGISRKTLYKRLDKYGISSS